MNKKITGIVAYIGIIGWLIAFLAGDKKGAKFHLNQALVIAIAEIILSVAGGILAIIPLIGGIITSVLGIVLFVFWLLGLISAIKDEEKALPIIGGIKILK